MFTDGRTDGWADGWTDRRTEDGPQAHRYIPWTFRSGNKKETNLSFWHLTVDIFARIAQQHLKFRGRSQNRNSTVTIEVEFLHTQLASNSSNRFFGISWDRTEKINRRTIRSWSLHSALRLHYDICFGYKHTDLFCRCKVTAHKCDLQCKMLHTKFQGNCPNRPWAGNRPPSPPLGEFCTLWFSKTTLYKKQNDTC